MKAKFRLIVEIISEFQLKRLLSRNNPQVIAVLGGVGKTSTKLAINSVLSEKYRVRTQLGNYNVPIGIPLVAFGMTIQGSVSNPFAWILRFIQMEIQIWRPIEFDVLLLELGTDKPSEIPHFASYLRPDICVITAIVPEHMENFESLDDVANEELAMVPVSGQVIAGHDDIDPKYIHQITQNSKSPILTYGLKGKTDLSFELQSMSLADGTVGYLMRNNKRHGLELKLPVFGLPAVKSALAAALVGEKLGMSHVQLHKGLESIVGPSGRMQILAGVNGSTIIDDTYNSSPEAVVASLKAMNDSGHLGRKIAVMGSMNELGEESPRYHTEVGIACAGVDLLITIGTMANDYLGPAAVKAGLDPTAWKPSDSPYAAGEYLRLVVGKDDLILAKGSQNGVFAEEAVKAILADSADEPRLVRQSPWWIKRKKRQFEVQ